tara:strand:+ start:6867 stop:7100 length:234 start_codon:yes stop_codon:yes gene_type:complete
MDELEMLKHMQEAMENSFNVIVGNTTIEELIINYGLDELVFAHNVETGVTSEDIENIRNYFIDKEDYEKCAELTKMF